jgi:hypothetical protein
MNIDNIVFHDKEYFSDASGYMYYYRICTLIAEKIVDLTNWEQDFLYDLYEDTPKTFSTKQVKVISDLYEKYHLV